jgi:hypothetical protein
MKFRVTTLALSLAALGSACVGTIPGSGNNTGPGGGQPSGPGGPGSPGPGGNGSMPGPGGPVNQVPVAQGTCNETTLSKPRVWRLTHGQVRNTLRDAFDFAPAAIDNFPEEARIDATNSRNGFANRADELKVSPVLAEMYFAAGDELAANVAANAAKYGITCPMAMLGAGQGACLKSFLQGFGTKMWRRPLADAEINSLTALYTTAAGQGTDAGPEAGLKTVVQAMFMSPNFLFRSELGDKKEGVTRLTDHELASALSYALWDTGPDAQLLDLAKQGRLRDQAVLTEQAKRLMASVPRASSAMHHFVDQWLHTEAVGVLPKDPMVFSMGTKEMAADVKRETEMFFDSVLFQPGGDKSFKTLFTASYSFLNARTAALYGVQGVTGDAFVKKDLDPAQRRGLLTHASFMWGHANPDGTHPVERGRYFREEILCEGVPDPLPNIIIDPKFGDKTLSARERLEIHLKEPTCAACHKLIDGLGLSMENYDGIGRYRQDEIVEGGAAKRIDASGTVPLPSDGTVLEFTNLLQLIDKLADKKDVYSCFASQYLDYTGGRRSDDLNTCERKLVTDKFIESGYNVDQLMLAVIGSPSFTARRN